MDVEDFGVHKWWMRLTTEDLKSLSPILYHRTSIFQEPIKHEKSLDANPNLLNEKLWEQVQQRALASPPGDADAF